MNICKSPKRKPSSRPDLLEGFLREGHDPAYIGTPMPIETFMHRDWETFTKEGL